MRPIILTMQAFGPYKDQMTIQFPGNDQVTQESLFLITGPTGAGKTTIFDAIVFALYGQTSGSTRQIKELKSDYASVEDLAYVALDFIVQDKNYHIYRELPQDRINKRGKVSATDGKCELTGPGENEIWTKKTEVKEVIEELIGLQVDQFRQIVMLAQGEFQKLLLASSKEKTLVLRHLFATDHLFAFQDQLKQRLHDLKQKLSQQSHQVKEKARILAEAMPEWTADQFMAAIDNGQTSLIKEEVGNRLNQLQEKRQSIQTEISQLAKQAKHLDKVGELLSKQAELEAEAKKLNQANQSIEEKRKKVQAIEATQTRYQLLVEQHASQKRLQTAQTKLETLHAEGDELAKKWTAFKRLAAQWEEAIQSLDSKRKHQQDLVRHLEKWDRYQSLQTEWRKLQKQTQRLEEDKENKGNQQKQASSQIEELKQVVLDNEQALQSYQNLTNRQLAYHEREGDLDRQQEAYKQLIDRKTSLLNQEEELQKACQDQDQQAQNYQQLYQAYFQNLAGVLAEDLVPGQACPVCGATDHPQLAHLSTDDVSKDRLEAAQAANDQAKSQVNRLANQIESNREAITSLLEQYHFADDAEWASDLQKSAENLLAEKKKLDQDQAEYQSLLNQVDNDKKDLSQVEKQAQELATQYEVVSSQLQSTQNSEKEKADQCQDLEKNLYGESQDQVQAEYEEIKIAIQSSEEKAQSLDKERQKLEQEKISNKSKRQSQEELITSLQAELADKEAQLAKESSDWSDQEILTLHQDSNHLSEWRQTINHYDQAWYANQKNLEANQSALSQYDSDQDISQVKQAISTLEQKQADLQEASDQVFTDFTHLDQNFQDYQNSGQAYGDLEKSYGDLESLDTVANGRSTAYGKIPFESYVLGRYLDQILAFANERLRAMTNERYELLRIQEYSGGNASQGLDLAVFDYQTGEERSVNTLSGGETFKASLSLALGLSDVMQNYAGGIQVETLFIDEGFGSLDTESLQSAVATLVDLQENSGRLVGIISHVDELKQEIPLHLEVKAGPHGSSAQFIGANNPT
ncbi:AAA family ATPase [Aerococcus kribbianus]|uniref:Nuclease SbcCD subunit C n=1 Tax=Aerococcus kribbianus TaxID=2999064 RepID=A0A9X3FV31_9LACT|nr:MULTISPECIES: SMC family ATPase [unclassified Aerococcus]MCZ0717491.1 SMC family ATPase [Aerococcus sp. YH-aer221]MCZ0725779.1 SMC family ATPase [Aerococcus sp. YH-aer222]